MASSFDPAYEYFSLSSRTFGVPRPIPPGAASIPTEPLDDYFAEHVDYLLVALLPDDAAAIECDHERIPASAF